MPKRKPQAVPPKTAEPDAAPNWAIFFREQRSPVVRSQLITALMSGTVLQVERLPLAALLDAVLLSMASRNYYEAEIIDDYNALLRRTDTAWKDQLWSCRVFSQQHMGTADFVVRGADRFNCTEDAYIPELVQWFLEHDPPKYFKKELTEKDLSARARKRAA